MSTNGRRRREQKRQLEEKKKIHEERDERQLRQQAHQQNIKSTQERPDSEKARYLNQLMETSMTDAGVNLLDNMIDRSFILGNISNAEYHDIKWEMHGMFLKIKSQFPPEESVVTGELRAFIFDDKNENLMPLTGQQRIIIAQMIRGVTMLVSRSKDGFQQEINVKSISVSEVMDPDDSEEKSKLGLFN